MAEYGKIVMKKLSGGVLNVTATDGASNTDLVLPLSGTVLAADINGNVCIGTSNPIRKLDVQNYGISPISCGARIAAYSSDSSINNQSYLHFSMTGVGGAELEAMSAYIDSIRKISNKAEQDGTKVEDIQWL